MQRNRFFPVLSCALFSAALAACQTPTAYRPEVEAFTKATAETSAYMTARVEEASDVRKDLRREILLERKPVVTVAPGCTRAILAFNQEAGKPKPAPLPEALLDSCQLLVPENEDLAPLFNPRPAMRNASRFANSVADYAAALDRVSVSADQAGFEQSVQDLGKAMTSLANGAAKAANEKAPTLPELGLVTAFVAKASFYYLENRRADALKEAAAQAQPLIEKGSAGVVRVLYAARFESVNAAKERLNKRLDAVNEDGSSAYVSKADQAVAAHGRLLTLLSGDPAAPFTKLPTAHQALIEALDDPKRNLAPAVAAAMDLFNAARAAKTALADN